MPWVRLNWVAGDCATSCTRLDLLGLLGQQSLGFSEQNRRSGFQYFAKPEQHPRAGAVLAALDQTDVERVMNFAPIESKA